MGPQHHYEDQTLKASEMAGFNTARMQKSHCVWPNAMTSVCWCWLGTAGGPFAPFPSSLAWLLRSKGVTELSLTDHDVSPAVEARDV